MLFGDGAVGRPSYRTRLRRYGRGKSLELFPYAECREQARAQPQVHLPAVHPGPIISESMNCAWMPSNSTSLRVQSAPGSTASVFDRVSRPRTSEMPTKRSMPDQPSHRPRTWRTPIRSSSSSRSMAVVVPRSLSRRTLTFSPLAVVFERL